MSRRAWLIVAAFLVAAGAGVAARLFLWPPQTAPQPSEVVDDRPVAVAITEALVLKPAELYFPSRQGGLRVHTQALPEGESLERIRVLVQALIDGPGGVTDGDLYSPVPESTVLQSVYVLKSGAVALDLRSKAVARPIASAESNQAEAEGSTGQEAREDETSVPLAEVSKLALGSEDELLAVYSFVNTVVLNGIEGVDRVVLLWDGRQPETFAGHVDVSRPLAADTSWVITP